LIKYVQIYYGEIFVCFRIVSLIFIKEIYKKSDFNGVKTVFYE